MGEVERVETGIPGLDELIQGGLPKGSATLVSGGSGTGKTIFSTQYILHGLKNGERCMFITFEETPEDIKADAQVFDWNLEKYEDNEKLVLEYRDPFQTTDITTVLQEEIVAYDVDRVAIDSTSVLGLYFDSEHKVRKQLFKLAQAIKETDATTVLTAEMLPDGESSRFGVESFIADAVVHLYYVGSGDGAYRQMEVKKMRRTNQKKGSFPFKITDDGIEVTDSAI